MYPSGYLTIGSNGSYTKHYFDGSKRIMSGVGESSINTFNSSANLQEIKNLQVNDLTRFLGSKPSFKDYVISEQEKNQTYYFHSDYLNSTTFLTDFVGNPYEFFLNLPFGETFVEEKSSGSFNNPYKFSGKELDKNTGFYLFGARYYNPKTSLWLSLDPLAELFPSVGGYVYSYNNPIMFSDPSGLAPEGTGDGGKENGTCVVCEQQLDEVIVTGGKKKFNFVTRALGALQGIGGVVEIVFGGIGGILTAETGVGLAAGLALAANGIDNANAGFKQMWTGRTTQTVLHQTVETVSKNLGADDETAGNIATGVDLSTMLIGGGVGSASSGGKLLSKGKQTSVTANVADDVAEAGLYSATTGTAKNVDKLINSGNLLEKGGLTSAGRALQKHGDRIGSIFPKVKGNAKVINEQAQKVLENILNNPNVKEITRNHARFGEILEFKIPNGQGVRFSGDGKKLIGFIEP